MIHNPFFTFYSALMAQPQMDPFQTAQPGGGGSNQGLEGYTLPTGPVTTNDMLRIQTVMAEVMKSISDAMASSRPSGKYLELSAVKEAVTTFMAWLNRQVCIRSASTTYDLAATENYGENIFSVYPGQLPFDIVFDMKTAGDTQYRLMIFVSRVDLLSFGNLMENTSLAGIPVPEPWPMGYLDKKP